MPKFFMFLGYWIGRFSQEETQAHVHVMKFGSRESMKVWLEPDIEVEYIENPQSETSKVDLDWWKTQRKRLLSRLGTVGGSVRSPRKAAASHHNGTKGGRPRKKKGHVLA